MQHWHLAGPQLKANTAWNESLHSSLHKRVSLVLPCWRLARTTSYRPFCTASSICCMLSIRTGRPGRKDIIKKHWSKLSTKGQTIQITSFRLEANLANKVLFVTVSYLLTVKKIREKPKSKVFEPIGVPLLLVTSIGMKKPTHGRRYIFKSAVANKNKRELKFS